MIKKRIASALLAATMLTGTSAMAKTLEITIGDTNVCVSDKTVESKTVDSAPYIENGRTMVPVRFISENFDASVNWDEATQKVTIVSGENTIELTIGSTVSMVNGSETALDVAPAIVNGRTMVPLRFVSQTLGKTVEYIDASKQIRITDIAPVLDINGDIYTIDDYKFIMLSYNLPNTVDVLTQMLPEITNYIIEVGAVYSESKNVLEDTALNDAAIAESIIENRASIEPLALTSTAIKHSLALSHADDLVMKSNSGHTDEEINAIYKNEYVRAKHILVSTVDLKTGEPLSDADKTKALKKAKEALKKAQKGTDFDKLIEEYNEDPGMTTNPDGYVFTKGEMVKPFEEKTFEIKENEISDIVETDYGYHIIQKLPLPEIDEQTKTSISNVLFGEAANKFVTETVNKADVKQLMSNEDIIKYLCE